MNIKDNNQVRVRFYDKNISKECDGLIYGCVVVFDYLAFVNELSYDDNLEGNIILNNDIIKVLYKSNKYFICSD